jgi:ubiquinone/menaquinone biosynthesis C-methylase UbiE
MNIFNEYSKYYDLIYSDKDYGSEVNYLDTLFELNTKPKNILEFGCGTGMHASILAKKNTMSMESIPVRKW